MFAALAAAACGEDEASSSAAPPSIATGDYGIRFNREAAGVELVRRGRVLLALPADAILVGRVDAVDDATNYDPYPLLATAAAGPAGLRWLGTAK